MLQLGSISQVLILHAEERSQKVAYSGPEGSITFGELDKRTRRIATKLVLAGKGRHHSAAVFLDRCIEAAESVLAITRAGAVAVPLDPRSSPVELARALDHSGARVIFTDGRHLDTVRAAVGSVSGKGLIITANPPERAIVHGWRVLRYQDWAGDDAGSTSNVRIDELEPEEPAFLHYTSGTTGTPKGVLSTQRSWIRAANNFVSAFGMTSDDYFFWPLPLFHCLGHALCVFATVAVGASAYIPAADARSFNSLFDKEARATTIIVGAPATYHEFIAEASNSKKLPSLPGLRACMSAGSSATAALSAQVQAVFGVPILNNYGCTEACGAIAINKPGDSFREDSSGTIVPGMEVQFTGPDGKVVNIGETGEVWVRSDSLMLRYFEETESPFTAEGWFRTGDMARRTANATDLNLVGRKKELINQGGENIQPDELERVLLRCAGVADVVVAGAPHNTLGETAAAFIVRDNRGNDAGHNSTLDLDPTHLLSGCRKDLPDNKVPTAFYEIDAVPRTLLGKPRRSAVSSNTSRPLTVRPKLLSKQSIDALVLAELLGACNLDVWPEGLNWETTFADLGLKSLGGTLFTGRLSSLTGLDLPTTLLYDFSSPAMVSAYLYEHLLVPEHGLPPSTTQQAATHTIVNGEAERPEPIAIIADACRYPGGVTSPEDLWRIVDNAKDVTSEFPNDRGWDLENLYNSDPAVPGTATTRRGAFLNNMADFDARAFGMSPREALATDPQQRLLLEQTWELIERGRIAPSSLRGTQTGVYIGIMYDDYEDNGLNKPELEAHLGLGSSGSVVSGRISYCFGLNGPSICVHSGCSSSLVAIHLGISSLRSGESSLVIAGGVTTMATPRPFLLFSRRQGLSPDGRCRAYSSDADGTGWSEGIGMVLLERLEDAKRHGHRVLGVIRGSAVNSDGASNGLTAPSGPAQQQVIQTALSQAGLSPADVDVVEGHGTATPLGDPIEVQALISAYGNGGNNVRRPPSAPLLLGSIKSNIGHSQAAAGVAGVIKMVHALRHGVAPASLHIRKPSKEIEWEGSGVELLTQARQWPAPSSEDGSTGVPRPRRAAVSSFGIGGTNAHVILEQYVASGDEHERAPKATKRNWSFPWLLSGADKPTLQAQARSLLADEALRSQHPVDIAFSLATTRSLLHCKAAIVSNSSQGRREALAALAQGQPHPDVLTGEAEGNTSIMKPRLAVLFSGQGTRLPSIGELEELCAFPVFSEAFQAACDELDQHLERPLNATTHGCNGNGNAHLMDRTDFVQAATFAFEVAMFRLLQSFNIHPDFVAGHSFGEIVAAHIAGSLSLREAATIVTARGRLMAALPANGAMVSISATKDEVAEDRSRYQHQTQGVQPTIAALNSKNSVVVSGPVEAVMAVADRFEASGRKASRLQKVDKAFHSQMMEPILDDLENALTPLLHGNGRQTMMTLISTVTGKVAEAAQLSSWRHWILQVCKPVLFADAVEELRSKGVSEFLEIGPSAVLRPHVPGAVATSSQVNRLLGTLGQLCARGIQVNWHTVFDGSGARAVNLPVYAFQRRRYWLDPPKPEATQRGLPDVGALNHGVLFSATSIPGTAKIICSGLLSTNRQPWLRDHMIGGQLLVPAAVIIELALRASRECTETQDMMMLEELALVAPLVLSETEDEEFHVQAVLGEPQENGERSVDVYSRPSDSATGHEWTLHANGTLQHCVLSDESRSSTEPASAGTTHVDISKAYAVLSENRGIGYGPSFQCVRAIWHGENRAELQARIEPPRAQSQKFALHPAMLDAALHASLLAASDTSEASIRLPFIIRGVQFLAPAGSDSIIAQIRDLGNDKRSVMLRSESTGALLANISEVITRLWQPPPAVGDLYRLEWTSLAATTINGEPATDPSRQTDEIFRVQVARDGDAEVAEYSVKHKIHDAVAEALRVIQKWIAEKALAGGRLVLVTERATKEDGPDIIAAAVWGFGRSAQAEFSGERIKLVDLDGSTKSEAALLPALASKEDVVALREGTIMTPRLVKAAPTAAQIPASPQDSHSSSGLDVSGTVLVTGGTGGLGALLSRHVVRTHGAKHLLLVSRSGMKAPGARQLSEELQSPDMGAVVRIEKCDCGDRDKLAALLAGNVAQGHPPISAVIHCAGVVDDSLLKSQSPERVSRVLRPKVDAAWNLHELTLTTAGTFILFSSYVGIVGNEGQAGYTAGNAFLDALARFRVARGLPALSLAWGPWQNEDGMAAADKLATPSARLTNAQPLTDQQGLQLFDMALQTSTSSKGAPVLSPMLLRGPFPLVPSAYTGTASATKTPGRSVTAIWRTKLAAAPPVNREEILLGLLRDQITSALGYSEDQDLPDLPIADLGIDSATGIPLANKLRTLTGLRDLAVSVVLDFVTVQELAKYLSQRLDLARPEVLETDPEAQDATIAEDVETSRAAVTPNGEKERSSTSGTADLEHGDVDMKMFGGLRALHTRLSHLGQYTAAQDALVVASMALPTFNTGSNLASHAVPPYHLANGILPFPIIFVSPFFPAFVAEGYRSSVYAPVAAGLKDLARDVFELPHPEGLAVPEDLETLAAVHMSTIRNHFTGPIILGGFSAGGTVALAVASKLAEEIGQEQKVQVVGFFLIDTYLNMTGRDDPDWLNALPVEALTTRAASLVKMVDNFDLAMARMGAYFRTLRDFKQPPLPETLPKLFMRAKNRSSMMPEDENKWRPSWDCPHVAVNISGSHLEVLDKKYAPDVAEKLHKWASEHVDCTRIEDAQTA